MSRKTGKVYEAFTQGVNLNNDGGYVMRWNIGINGYNEWTCKECIYENDEFNNRYVVVKYSYSRKMWIPETEYKFWIDGKEAK